MIISFLNKQQIKNLSQIIWKNYGIKQLRNIFITNCIADIIVITIIWLWALSMVKIIIIAAIIINILQFFAIKYKCQKDYILKSQDKYIFYFAANDKKSQLQYIKMYSKSDILKKAYQENHILSPEYPNYQINEDPLFKILYKKLNLEYTSKQKFTFIETKKYILLLLDNTKSSKKQIPVQTIYKSKDNLNTLNNNQLSVDNLKKKASNYLFVN